MKCLGAFPITHGFVVVFPLFEHDDFFDIIDSSPMSVVRSYMRALFRALAHVHSKVGPVAWRRVSGQACGRQGDCF